MIDLKRFEIWAEEFGGLRLCVEEDSKNGSWVKYEDHKAKVEEMKKDLEDTRKQWTKEVQTRHRFHDDMVNMEDEIKKLENHNAELLEKVEQLEQELAELKERYRLAFGLAEYVYDLESEWRKYEDWPRKPERDQYKRLKKDIELFETLPKAEEVGE